MKPSPLSLLAVLAVLAALAVALGGCESPVGYRGPLPSSEARGTVNALPRF